MTHTINNIFAVIQLSWVISSCRSLIIRTRKEEALSREGNKSFVKPSESIVLEVTFSIMQLMLKIKSNAIHKQTHQQHKKIIIK
jgi:hypothetical protein